LLLFGKNDFGDPMEWAIVRFLPFDTKSGAFSATGDSGSVVADGTSEKRENASER
jgi:hypothetical protein